MTPVAEVDPPPRTRPSIPAPGMTVGAAVEARASHFRAAARVLADGMGDRGKANAAHSDWFASRWRDDSPRDRDLATIRMAWGLVAIHTVGRLLGILRSDSTLREAEAWFLRGQQFDVCIPELVSDEEAASAVQHLSRVPADDELSDLLPYILDAHGPGSRASVLRDPSTSSARKAKRANGVFYTPADVAEYIAKESIKRHGGSVHTLRILDPACGSGVFLRASLSTAINLWPDLDPFEFAEQSLFGVDIDPLAVEMACFVLLHDCLRAGHAHSGESPWSLWHRLRCNLLIADSLMLDLGPPENSARNSKAELRRSMSLDSSPPSRQEVSRSVASASLFRGGIAMCDALPELAGGADVVIGNPPYAAIGVRDDRHHLEDRFESFSGGTAGGRTDFFPLFVEMMWRLAKVGHSSAGMVVPLSIAYQSRTQMVLCRKAMMKSGGQWNFAFFDREPHALFGEDVKTRNAIVFRTENALLPSRNERAIVETGPLRKWTSRMRPRLFSAIDFTPLEGGEISEGIPKLAGAAAASAFKILQGQPARLPSLWVQASPCLPETACLPSAEHQLFVATTAYNFLNIFRMHRRLPPARAPWSESSLLRLTFASEELACATMAILSSRLVYWLWHVLEDGFHVTRSFVEHIPVGVSNLGAHRLSRLATLGAEHWDALQVHQVVSVNGGRQTIAYRPHACDHVRDQIDSLLVDAVGIDAKFAGELKTFARGAVAVDESDIRRHKLLSQFLHSEGIK